MFVSSSVPPPILPQPRLRSVHAGISLLPPLSRKGVGPGLIVLCPDTPDSLAISEGVPWPLIKWAEEGYSVVEIRTQALTDGAEALQHALTALNTCEECSPNDKIGIVGTCVTALDDTCYLKNRR